MQALAPAFADPVAESQSVFRALMNAMARPGLVQRIVPTLDPPGSLSRGTAAVALTLLDFETPFWLDADLRARQDVIDWLRFHTGAPLVTEPRQAAFAFVSRGADLPPFDSFSLGSMDYPDRSTTLVVNIERFGSGDGLTLAGPGIAEAISFSVTPIPADFAARLAANRALFPRGVDLIFVTDESLAALPRSVRVLTED